MDNPTSSPWLRRLIVAALLAGLVVLGFQVLQPFIVPVVWAGVLAYVTWPAYRKLLAWFGGRRALASLVMTLALFVAVVAPIVWIVALRQVEVVRGYQEVLALLARGPPQLPDSLLQLPVVGDWLRELTERIARDPSTLGDSLRQLADRSFGEVTKIAGGVGRNVVKLLFAVLTLFFMYRDGKAFAAQMTSVLEGILGQRVHNYIDAIGQTVKAVVYGLVLAALAQGTLAGLGYWAAGVDAPVFLGAFTTIAALVPFAVPFVWITVGAWLLLSGKTVAGIGLFLWGATAVSWIDNIVRPLVISSSTRIPFLLVLFGVLGGLAAFGLVGLFIGPVILAVLIAVWREWLAEARGVKLPEPPDPRA